MQICLPPSMACVSVVMIGHPADSYIAEWLTRACQGRPNIENEQDERSGGSISNVEEVLSYNEACPCYVAKR